MPNMSMTLPMKTVVWNLQQKSKNWHLLGEWDDVRDADIYLLCEAPPAPPGVPSVGLGRTEGLEVALGPDRPVTRPWSTAIASPQPLEPITDARLDRYYKVPLPSSHHALAHGRQDQSTRTVGG